MIRRLGWFIITNFLVLITIGVLIRLFGIDVYAAKNGTDYQSLLVLSAIFGFSGALVSLFLSKEIAKMSTGAKVIHSAQTQEEAWLLQTVEELAAKAEVQMPEVAVYEGAPNAFATGATKNGALVAVSTGLLQSMTRPQIKAVLAHEMSHVVNGDMVTMTLLQGVLNTFVFFFARVAAIFLQKRSRKGKAPRLNGFEYYMTVQVFEFVFGILASIAACAFSRKREFRADEGAAGLLGSPDAMIEALKVLGGTDVTPLPSEIKAFGITDLPSVLSLFSTHPPISQRIKALSSLKPPSGKGFGGLFKNVRG